jgi:hypothetical protein
MKHLPVSSEKDGQSLAGPTSSQQKKNGEVKGSKPLVPPYVLDQQGNTVPLDQYDPHKGHLYIGPHHPCPRCLVRQIPLPVTVCGLCRDAHAAEASA